MTASPSYPKRLIEVDLPIKRISEHARREKSIRHGHISTLHIWWARRPLASCRAVILAALWPDPGDDGCPDRFRKEARRWILRWASEFPTKVGAESAPRLLKIRDDARLLDDPKAVRQGLLDFIADFANWDLSNDPDFLAMSRALVQCAHECLGGAKGTRPLVIDPFAGGGAIPLEALRVGADPFASDLNPVPVLLNKVALEYIPKYGQTLANQVRKWGAWVKGEAEKALADFYPKDPDGATPIAYLWARTIRCEGPGCGAEVPLLRSTWLAKKKHRSVAMRIRVDKASRTVAVEIEEGAPLGVPRDGTIRLGSALCPVCGFSNPLARVRAQLKERRGGTRDARLVCVVVSRAGAPGRTYRAPNERDLAACAAAGEYLMRLSELPRGEGLSAVPDEAIPQLRIWKNNPIRVHLYGMVTWGDLFTARQAAILATIADIIRRAGKVAAGDLEPDLAQAVQSILALALSRLVDRSCSLCTWRPQADQEKVEHVFTRQALSMTWDFAEGNPFSAGTACWDDAYEPPVRVIEALAAAGLPAASGSVVQVDAAQNPLPDDFASAFITDPPYYDAVPYADLTDFFYVWLRRALPAIPGIALAEKGAPKDDECVMDEGRGKGGSFFEDKLTSAMETSRRVVAPTAIGVVVFAHKSTSGWEAAIGAMLRAGWIVTASWPIDTEMGTRLRAQNSAALSSSIHLVCRPRENADGSLRADAIGDWRDILHELPNCIHEWMPRLISEGIVGADAIFACLGPALELFSRYSKVEKASGDRVELKEYLEHVWAAVAKEALGAIFSGAETAGFEEDARLTAMWLWTLKGSETAGADEGRNNNDAVDEPESSDLEGQDAAGFILEYDAARKIAQGLGAHLEALESLVQVKGANARLLSVGERAAALFGDPESFAARGATARKKKTQLNLGFLEEVEVAEERSASGLGGNLLAKPAGTVLDRVHQAMILFGAGRGEALRRFLVDDGVGKDERFWRLAQALNQLYPTGTDERRWVEGVMARKKGLGL